MHDVAQTLNVESDYLIGRADGRCIAEHLRNTLSQAAGHGVVNLAFDQVELMDGSFADEVFGAIAAERSQGKFAGAPMILQGLNPSSCDNLNQSLLSRPVREPGLRNCVIPVLSGRDNVQLCGKSEDHVQQTFGLLNRVGELTAKTLADMLGLTISAASTRLKVLFDLGLAVRHEVRDANGKQYTYQRLT